MRSSLDEPVAEPSLPQLQKYYRQEMKNYEIGEVYSLDQVYFSFGAEPEDGPSLLAALRSGGDPTQFGEHYTLGASLTNMSESDLRRMFGSAFTATLLAQEMGNWAGPFESRVGIHYVCVNSKQQGSRPSFEQLQDYLRQDWMFNERRKVQTEKIAEMRKQYRIVLTEP